MRYITAIMVLSLGLLLSGYKAPDGTASDPARTVAKISKTTRNTTLSGKKSKNSKNSRSEKETHEDGELTKRELKIINTDLNSEEYYGFLLSDYDDPRFIDWDEVFYLGAGLDRGRLSKAEEKEFLKKTRSDEIYTDLTVLSGKDVEDFVEKTTGMTYSKMKNALDWTYLNKYDLYVFEHGDTNRVNVDVISGYVEDGTFTVRYIHENWWGDNSDCEYEVCFTRDDDQYCFISNTPDPNTGSGQYILPDSASRYLTEADLKGMDNEKLRLARNEIYARHGRQFKDSSLQSYFDSKSWYVPGNDSDSKIENSLNKFEKKNIQFISKHEK